MKQLKVIQADITGLNVDAIVNAANNSLLGGGGVDGAIHRAAGPELLKACKLLNGCETGEAKITQGFLLPAKYIIHTVGPVYQNQSETESEKLLAKAYESSLLLALNYQLHSIAFPNISTGVYGYPKKTAAKIAIETCRKFSDNNSQLDELIFCCFDEENYRIYLELLMD